MPRALWNLQLLPFLTGSFAGAKSLRQPQQARSRTLWPHTAMNWRSDLPPPELRPWPWLGARRTQAWGSWPRLWVRAADSGPQRQC